MLKLRRMALMLALAALALLTACGGQEGVPAEPEQEPFTLTAALELPETLDPVKAGGTVTAHLFENLMAWGDGGEGFAQLVPGQAESYTVETDYAGCATCTFKLREGLQWSDGEPVEAEDFAAAWRRLADPANELPGRELLSIVAGYHEVQETGDPSLLAVSAPDAGTFVVTLQGGFAGFLEELCAGTATMPLRQELLDSGRWGRPEAGMVSNGPYTLASAGSGSLRLEKNPSYHTPNPKGAEVITFVSASGGEADYAKLQNGELDFVLNLPDAALRERRDSGTWLPEPEAVSYCVLFNTRRAPFDVPEVRQALCLAVDQEALAAALDNPALRPAPGLVPYGVADYGQRDVAEEPEAEEEPVLPGGVPVQEPEEEPAILWDFRAHAQELVTLADESDYAANCAQAKALLAQAGYGQQRPFPEIEYLYVDTPEARAAAQALSQMWQQELGITVTPRSVTQEEYDAALAPPESGEDGESGGDGGEEPEEPVPAFQLAAQAFTASRDDAGAFLNRWRSGRSPTGYASSAFDILMDSASAALAPDALDARDAYLHDAEAILLSDGAVLPLFCQGSSFALAEDLTGLCRTAGGVYLFTAVEERPEA